MKMYLQFESLELAETANIQISQNMGLVGNFTVTWAGVEATADEKFVISKPEDRFMEGIVNFQEVESFEVE